MMAIALVKWKWSEWFGKHAGDAYHQLVSFRNILRALAVAMGGMAPEEDPVPLSFMRLAEEFSNKLAGFNGPRRPRV